MGLEDPRCLLDHLGHPLGLVLPHLKCQGVEGLLVADGGDPVTVFPGQGVDRLESAVRQQIGHRGVRRVGQGQLGGVRHVCHDPLGGVGKAEHQQTDDSLTVTPIGGGAGLLDCGAHPVALVDQTRVSDGIDPSTPHVHL